jgi:hypothetical protein
MKKTTTTKSERVFPFHDCPFTIFKNIFNNASHLCSRKFLLKHFSYCRFSNNGLICDLMIYRIFII